MILNIVSVVDIRMRPRLRFGGIRVLEVIKLLFAISIGFCIRIMVERQVSITRSGCPECPTCDNPEESIQACTGQLREPFKPKSRHEVLRYQYFNSSNIFDYFDENPKTGLMGHQRSDISDIMSQSMALYNSRKVKPWQLKRLVNGYRRFDPLRGEEYVLDIEMFMQMGSASDKSDLNKRTEVQRMQIVKPFGTAQMVSTTLFQDQKMIHFILPVTTSVNDRFDRFIKNFEEVCLKMREHVYLLVVLFGGKAPTDKTKADALRESMHKLHQKYRSSHIRVVQTNKDFSRALGLDLGAKQLPPEALMFFCDIDVAFTSDFLNRCRHNTIQNSQVYYPVVFAQYNPEVIKKYTPYKEIKHLLAINKHTGMGCIIKCTSQCESPGVEGDLGEGGSHNPPRRLGHQVFVGMFCEIDSNNKNGRNMPLTRRIRRGF